MAEVNAGISTDPEVDQSGQEAVTVLKQTSQQNGHLPTGEDMRETEPGNEEENEGTETFTDNTQSSKETAYVNEKPSDVETRESEEYDPDDVHVVEEVEFEDNLEKNHCNHDQEDHDCDVDHDEEEEEEEEMPYPGVHLDRKPISELPETVTLLETNDGGKVYIVGTAHFSQQSQEDVAKMIGAAMPDVVVVELCCSRVNILQLDEATLLEEAKNINLEKMRVAIKQSGVVQGVMHLLLLSMSAHLTKQLGMAPGGEFRRAFKEAQKVSGCRVHLGDRPIQITLQRALGSLSLWQKVRLTWYMITSKEPISAEEVERCKQKDLLEEMLREMTGEFPALSRVFVAERDMYLAHSLKLAARPIPCPYAENGYIPAVVVGVVGIGHVPGIVKNWNVENDIKDLIKIPPPSVVSIALRWTTRAAVLGLVSWAGYKLFRLTSDVIVYTYQHVPFSLPLNS